ncbi:SCO1860 family LAETG-anchored protein [Streptomyces sp. CoH27]|uniref:SCO1860 family LAETG-anchored protein n=1 Tax=Streptomyces sp. CoH27 TaxID=2875763 RepID=UPI001CD3FDF2|nr:SCO1860 family LAETG-anchored protein [Streptomyces sp. CoH27]
MNSNDFRMPARRLAALATVTALTAVPAVLGAGAAHATGDHGRATAVVLRTGLDVSLLNKTVDVPLAVSLNEVQAPQSADRTALSARLDGVAGGRPFTVLGADVASAKATVTARRAEGSVRLAHARLHVPGLPLLSLIEADTVTADATCEAGKAPVAAANVLGAVTVLGKRVTLTAGGPTEVKVPGVGEVRLDLSRRSTTTRTAAATALELKVSVNPLKLNVADVEGTVTLARATCESPAPAPAGDPAQSHDPVADVKAQGSRADLAETGGSSATPYIAGGALALVLAGGGAVTVARRRKG